MAAHILDVYLSDIFVGKLKQSKAGVLTFAYDTSYLEAEKPAISISLPTHAEKFNPDIVKSFFSGLLPEEGVRHRLAAHLGLSEKNAFALLEAVGGDCAGALSLCLEGEKPQEQSDDIEVLDDKRLAEILDMIKRRPMMAGDDGYRLSLAGAQDKLAVGFKDGKVLLMKGGQPTTHILKPLIENVEDSVHNELFCMKLAKAVGLNVPEASIHYVNDMPYYLVSRYDRNASESGIVTRVHQEDFCQALGLPSEKKYEREGGPSVSDCLNILRSHTLKPAAGSIKFLDMLIFNYLIGNADAHGKNYSLLYTEDKPELAPGYDLLCTEVYPDLSKKMAMKIGGQYEARDVYLKHWHKLVPETKAAQSNMTKQLKSMAERVVAEAEALITSLEEEGIASPVYNRIVEVIKKRYSLII